MATGSSVRRGRPFVQAAVVVAILTVVAGMVIHAMARLRDLGLRSTCYNNTHQLALAVHGYADSWGRLPHGTMPAADLPPEQRLSWLMAITPYVEQDHVFGKANSASTWDSERNRPATTTFIGVFRCSRARPADLTTTYIGVAGVGADAATLRTDDLRAGPFGYDREVRLKDVKSTATTILIAETRTGGPWAQGGPGTVRGSDPSNRPHVGPDRPFGSNHVAESRVFHRDRIGMFVAMTDGSMRFVRESVAPEVWEAHVSIHDASPLPVDW